MFKDITQILIHIFVQDIASIIVKYLKYIAVYSNKSISLTTKHDYFDIVYYHKLYDKDLINLKMINCYKTFKYTTISLYSDYCWVANTMRFLIVDGNKFEKQMSEILDFFENTTLNEIFAIDIHLEPNSTIKLTKWLESANLNWNVALGYANSENFLGNSPEPIEICGTELNET